MLPKVVRRPLSTAFHLITAASLLASQGAAGAEQFVTARVDPGPDPFAQVDRKLITKWLKSGEYMPLSEIKPGMEGYGLSVFQGTKPERFNVKIIGVVKKVLNGRDAIMARLSGPTIGKNCVIRGMSGSPIYINNKIVGAVSYGFDFSTEPICGITPIADMLDALGHEEMSGRRQPDRISINSPVLAPDAVRSIETASGGTVKVLGGAPHMVPLMAPVSLAGFSPRAERFLRDHMQDQGMWVSSGSGGGLDPSLAKPHVAQAGVPWAPVAPGGAVSVMLSTGDFNSSACGTATATFGNHVLAFGHPFMSAGSVDFPMATAFVHQVLPSLSVSFKVASPVQVIGSFMSDRPWSVSGQIGRAAKLIPATYTVTDETRHIKRTFHCSVVDHPDLTPELVAATAMSAIDATHQSSQPYILKVKSSIEADSVGRIERVDRYSGNLGAHGAHRIQFGDPVGSFLMSATNKILNNEFEKTSLKGINVDISLEDGHNTAKIERIYVDKPIVAPGDNVKVSCVIRPYNRDTVVRTISIQVPRDVPDGNILLGVASGDDIDVVRKRIGLIDPPPQTLDQVAKKIRDAGSGDDIVAVMALPAQSILVKGTVLPNPPAHWAKLFFSDRYTQGPALIKGEVRAIAPQDMLLDGSHIMTVEVRRSEKVLSRSAPYLASSAGSFSSVDGIHMTDLARKTMDSFKRTDTPATAAVEKTTPFWSSTKEYPHIRSLLSWQQETQTDFMQGKPESTTVDSWGRISPALQDIAKHSVDRDMRIWSSAFVKDNFWFGTSDKVYKWKGDQSEPHLVATIDRALALPALVADSKGTLYVAKVPSGEIYSIDPDSGVVKLLAKLPEPTITCMCVDLEDNLYAGVTASGKVYKLPLRASAAEIKPQVFFDSGQADVTAMFYNDRDKRLYVGTAEKGAVYSVEANGSAHAEYQSGDHIITGVAKDSKGDLYISTAAQGKLLKIGSTGGPVTLATSEAFYTLYYDKSSDSIFSGDAEGDITRAQVDPLSHEPYFFPVCHTEQEAVLTLCSDQKGRLFGGTCNLAVARSFEMHPANDAVYFSMVKDGMRKTRWSKVRAYGAYNEVSEQLAKCVHVFTRTGDTVIPDSSWSAWQGTRFANDAFSIVSPSARYFQYKLVWKDDNAGSTKSGIAAKPISIGKIEVTYLPSNMPPEFGTISLKSGTSCSGKDDVTITATDPDNDNLSVSVEVSSDGAKTWQSVASDLRSHQKAIASAKTTESKPATPSTTTPVELKKPQPEAQPKEAMIYSSGDAFDTAGARNESVQSDDPVLLDDAKPEKPDEKPSEPDDKDKDKDKAEKDKDKDSPENKEAKKDEGGKSSDADKTAREKETTRKAQVPAAKGNHGKLPIGQPLAQINSADTAGSGEKIAWHWDTTKVKDGSYVVKFILDDMPSNPAGHLQTVALRTVDVDNTPPVIESVKCTKGSGNKAAISVKTHDKQTPIVNATYRFDEGEPFALGTADNITDALDAQFAVEDVPIPHGSHKLEVQITDRAGNTANKTVNLN